MSNFQEIQIPSLIFAALTALSIFQIEAFGPKSDRTPPFPPLMNQSEFHNHKSAAPKFLLINQWIMNGRAGYKTDSEKEVSTEIINRSLI